MFRDPYNRNTAIPNPERKFDGNLSHNQTEITKLKLPSMGYKIRAFHCIENILFEIKIIVYLRPKNAEQRQPSIYYKTFQNFTLIRILFVLRGTKVSLRNTQTGITLIE